MKTDIQEVHTAVIGAGSAGISAFRTLQNENVDAVLIDPGPLGTTCARTGCMPSKALIHTADSFYRRRFFEKQGIAGAEMLLCDLPAALEHVRQLRDRFVQGMVETIEKLASGRLISERAELLDEHRIQAGSRIIRAEQVILAVGADPVLPEKWKKLGDRVLTSETVFEQETLPHRMAVIGLGAVGLELGQAFSRLGLDVAGFSSSRHIGGLDDSQVNQEMVRLIKKEFPLYLGSPTEVDEIKNGELRVRSAAGEIQADAVLVAIGVRSNLNGIGLENLGIDPGNPPLDPQTGRLGDLPIYVAGDANGNRPVLHEAVDEGALAADRILHPETDRCSCRRVPLKVVFSDPEIVAVGTTFSDLPEKETVTGAVDFQDQSRAVIENRNAGRIHLYAERATGRLLGAEACVPEATSFGHLLALAIQRRCTVFDLLQMPFYHPTLADGLRTAVRHAADQCDPDRKKSAAALDWCCTEKPLS